MPATCSHCGFENPNGFRFCGRCGARLAGADEAPAIDDREATVRQLQAQGDAARQASQPAAALERYQQALALLDSLILAADATLQAQHLKSRFDILADRTPLWADAGRPERVEPDLEEMLALARRLGDGARLAQAVGALCRHYLNARRHEAARPLLEEAVSLLRSQSDRAGEASALADLAMLNWRDGRFDTVADALQRAHELRRHLAEPAGLARSYFDLGVLYRDGLSHPLHGVLHFEKSIELARQAGDAEREAQALIELGASWTQLGDYAQADPILVRARGRADEIGSARLQARQLAAQADVLRETRSAQARPVSDRAVAAASGVDEPDLEWQALFVRALVSQAESTWHDARASIDRLQALEHAGGLFAYCAIASLSLLARTHLHTGQLQAATAASDRAVTMLQAHGYSGVPAPQRILWAHYEVLTGSDARSAFHYLRQARELMLSQANTINDGALRARFLRDVSINRSIGDDWTRRHT